MRHDAMIDIERPQDEAPSSGGMTKAAAPFGGQFATT
jgi:hypothetical protein